MDMKKIDAYIDRMQATGDLMLAVGNTVINICGHDVVIDFTDADVLERFQDASKIYDERIDEVQNDNSLDKIQATRMQCAIIEDYIDAVLGDGISEKVFDGHHASMSIHYNAVRRMVEAARDAGKHVNDSRNTASQLVRAQMKQVQAAQFRNFVNNGG